MTDVEKVKEIVAGLQSEIKEALENVKTVAEKAEKVDKLEKRIEEVFEELRTFAERKTPATFEGTSEGVKELVSKYGVKSVHDIRKIDLYGTPNRWGDPKKLVSDEVEHVMHLNDMVHIIHQIAKGTIRNYAEECRVRGEAEVFKERFPQYGEQWDKIVNSIKATTLVTNTDGAGQDWIPTGFASTLYDEVRVRTPEASLIPHVTMPTDPWKYPKKTGVGQCYIRSEGSTITAKVLTTSKIQFDAYTFAVYEQFTDEMSEDSIIAVAPAVRTDIIRALSEGLSQAIVNGDSNGANHFDNDYKTANLGSGYPQNAAFSGLRQYCIDAQTITVSGGGDALSSSDIASAIKEMGKYAAGRTQDVIVLVGPEGWLSLLGDSSSNLITVDKYGPSATILTGEIGRVYGARVVISFGISEREGSVTTAGKNEDGGTNTFSTAVVFNPNLWLIGDRRDVRFETDKNIVSGVNQMVATARWAMKPMESGSTKKHTVAIVNIT